MNKKILSVLCMTFGFFIYLNTSATEVKGAISPTEINMDGAKKIALEKVNGTIISAKTEEDDGKTKYEIIVQAKDGTYEIEIDKATGKVLEVEKEGSDDDDKHEKHEDDDRYDD